MRFVMMMIMMMKRMSDNVGDGNHLHAIDVAAREEGDGGNGNAPTQEDENLAIARCYNSYNQ